MMAEIIQFIPRPRRDREQTDFPTIAFRAVVPYPHKDRSERVSGKYFPSDWQEK
jgi:hypothetical protein